MSLLILIVVTVILVSCVKSHPAIHGKLINATTTPNVTLTWEGTIDCYGRSFFDINPWHDKGLRTSASKKFTVEITDDGNFTFPSSWFLSTLRKKEIHYNCTLTDSEGRALGHVTAPSDGPILLDFYTKTVTIELVPQGVFFHERFPDNILLRITLREGNSGEMVEEIPLQLLLEGSGVTFSKDILTRVPQEEHRCTVSLAIIDQDNKLRSLTIPNGTEERWIFYCAPHATATLELPYNVLFDILKGWPDKIDSGEAVNWSELENVRKNPPVYFKTLKEGIQNLPDIPSED